MEEFYGPNLLYKILYGSFTAPISPMRFHKGVLYVFDTTKFDSRVKSRFWEDKSVFKMRKMGIKNTYDAGVIEEVL